MAVASELARQEAGNNREEGEGGADAVNFVFSRACSGPQQQLYACKVQLVSTV